MKKVFFSSVLITLLAAGGFYFYATLPDVNALKQKNPKSTALMELRDEEYKKKKIAGTRQQNWVGYGAISDHLKKAVLVSEDAAFFSHKGVDMNELKAALKKDWETMSFNRGGSTITMQLAKNLYLNPSKNPLRKLKEIVIAHQLEQALSKRRIFEIYLNVVEWGRNIYGIESAARHYFAKSAAALDPLEAATLAALLPSPRNSKERGVLNRRNGILGRLNSVGYLSNKELQRARQTPLYQKVEQAPKIVPVDEEPSDSKN
ncbi:MAG: monofunctional biosynthetic peptidoglycan transglycosylase [Deltaproteobacteria bacterium]|nr:monofunctional biosynthetic peptidoglycan transglycosylase [Deltaproteobacteria bacterium]